jgi:hypothetical protein
LIVEQIVHPAFARAGHDASMTLSEDEQHTLDEIGTSLVADDPEFAARLDVVAAQHALRRRRRVAGYGLWLGVTLLMLGATAAHGVLSIGAVVGCYGFLLLAWSTVTLLRCRSGPPGADPDRPPGHG